MMSNAIQNEMAFKWFIYFCKINVNLGIKCVCVCVCAFEKNKCPSSKCIAWDVRRWLNSNGAS